MAEGILICGLNGCGKTTLGKLLAEKTGRYFIDAEELYFDGESYDKMRTRAEAEGILHSKIAANGDFVLASVKGDYGADIVSMYRYIIIVDVPGEIRSLRIRERSFTKFGERMLAGGDMFESEEAFFQMAESRSEDYVDNWAKTVNCPTIRIDGTKPISENVEYLLKYIHCI